MVVDEVSIVDWPVPVAAAGLLFVSSLAMVEALAVDWSDANDVWAPTPTPTADRSFIFRFIMSIARENLDFSPPPPIDAVVDVEVFISGASR